MCSSQLILPLRIKQLVRAFIIRFRHKDLRRAAQIAFVGCDWINKFLRGGDAMLFQHHHEHFSVDHRASVKKFHAAS